MTADLGSVLSTLDSYARELDGCSQKLAKVEDELEPLNGIYEEAMDDAEASFWERHEDEGDKLPPQHMREVLARRSISPEIRSKRALLLSKRKRLEKRIRTLADLVDAQRSILSALKSEMEATRS